MASSDAKKGVDPKRRALESPETDKPFPRLRRRASLPDIQDATDPKPSYSLPELMKKGFMDPEIIKDIVPTMMVQLRPSIEAAIQHTMETTLATTISAVIEKSMSKYKTEVIHPLLKAKDAEISTLKTDLKESKKQVQALETKVKKLSNGLNDLEQYGRRLNLRLNNVPLPDSSKCEEVVLKTLNEALPMEAEPFTSNDIDRCHPIGKVNRKNNRQVIIRFSSYRARAKAYGVRFDLSNVYMSEDFTPGNQKFVNHLIRMRKAKQIKKFWSIDGKVYAKLVDNQGKFRIKSNDDILIMFQNAVEEGFIDEDEAVVATQPLLAPGVPAEPMMADPV